MLPDDKHGWLVLGGLGTVVASLARWVAPRIWKRLPEWARFGRKVVMRGITDDAMKTLKEAMEEAAAKAVEKQMKPYARALTRHVEDDQEMKLHLANIDGKVDVILGFIAPDYKPTSRPALHVVEPVPTGDED